MKDEDWDRRYAATDFIWTTEPNRFVVQELEHLPPGRALDLAAGEGRNAVWLAERGWRVTAVDFSLEGLHKARRLAAVRGVTIDWVLADLTEYEPDAGRYTLILVAYLQIPPGQRALVLRRAAATLAPDGVALVIGHDRTNLRDGVGGPQDPTLLYTPDEIAAELPGLTVHRAERVHRPVEIDGESHTAIDTLVTAVRH